MAVIRIGDFAVYKTTGFWTVRNVQTNTEVAHEPTKEDALKVARRLAADAEGKK